MDFEADPTPPVLVSLDAFKADLMGDFEVFYENWLEENGRDPEGWPMNMTISEWYEQFLSSFCG